MDQDIAMSLKNDFELGAKLGIAFITGCAIAPFAIVLLAFLF